MQHERGGSLARNNPLDTGSFDGLPIQQLTQLAIGFQDVVEQPALEIIEQALQRSRIVGPERFALRSKLPGKLAMHGQMSQCMLLLIGQGWPASSPRC